MKTNTELRNVKSDLTNKFEGKYLKNMIFKHYRNLIYGLCLCGVKESCCDCTGTKQELEKTRTDLSKIVDELLSTKLKCTYVDVIFF